MITQDTEHDGPWTPTWKPLSPEQRRVLGVLIEKAKTTPATYPMTHNAILLGCNQKNNRDPLMTLAAADVERILEELRVLGAVTEAHESTRSTKFRHRGYEWLGVERAELAVMAELLLRGAQTLGELRTRAARMEPIPDLPALKPIVAALVKRGLMIELTPPGRGQIVGPRSRGSASGSTSSSPGSPPDPAEPKRSDRAANPGGRPQAFAWPPARSAIDSGVPSWSSDTPASRPLHWTKKNSA